MRTSFLRDERGAIAMLTALALPALLAAAAFATDVAWWLVETRQLQYAADAAAVSAAFAGPKDYAASARAVATELGFEDRSGGITVDARYLSKCVYSPGGCYTVTISHSGGAMLSGLAPTLSATGQTAAGLTSGGRALVE